MIDPNETVPCALDPLVADTSDAEQLREAVALSNELSARVMADAMPQIVWTARPDGVRDYFNQRWYEHTGLDVDASEGWAWVSALHEEDRDRCRDGWRAAVQSNETFETEYRLYCADDGSYRWHVERALPVLDPACAVVKWFGTCTDVNELREARAQIESLNARLRLAMTETHHRVKNNLQIIMAMVDMQMADGPESLTAEQVKRLGTHIRTIAIVHDILTQAVRGNGHSEAISVKQVLESLLPIHQQTAPNCHIEADIADVHLPGRKGTALALTANELLSNAIKHGKSRVEIAVTDHREQIDVVVSDDGPGFPEGFDPAVAANTGLELVTNLVRWDLGGKIDFGNEPAGGARVVVTVPV